MKSTNFSLAQQRPPISNAKALFYARVCAGAMLMTASTVLAQNAPVAQDRTLPPAMMREIGVLADPASCTNDESSTAILLTHDWGEIYVPRDAPIGSVIGGVRLQLAQFDGKLVCRTGAIISLTMQRPGPLPPLNTPNDVAQGGRWVYPTNIPGIGVAIYVNRSTNTCPDHDGTDLSLNLTVCDGAPDMYFILADRTLVAYLIKTGPIAAGSHTLDSASPAYVGSASNIGQFAQGYLRGTITQSECSLPAAPGNQIRVNLGDWGREHFTGRGTTTDLVGFDITLQSCVAGTYTDTPSWNFFTGNYANVRFDPAKGSTTLDRDVGLISLGAGSTASGVAIQVLGSDGSTPMPIEQWNRLQHVEDGITTLRFYARYLQNMDVVNAGSANGSLNFTIEYR